MNENKWSIEDYNWGKIGRLKDIYRYNDRMKYTDKDYWSIDTDHEENGFGIDLVPFNIAGAKQNFVIKFWEFRNDIPKDHRKKAQRNSTEYNFIIEGEIRGSVADKHDIFLRAGDFIIIKPGNQINLQEEVIKNTKGITIKVPGIKNDEIYID